MNRSNNNTASRRSIADEENMREVQGATDAKLLRQLQELAFAKVECELYLDAYPECAAALEYYQELINKYNELMERFQNTVAPIRQESITGDRWTWVDTPWPWQLDGNGRER